MNTIKGKLPVGIAGKGGLQTDYELREPTTADYLDAENDAPVDKTLQYRAALIGRCVVAVGDVDGPISYAQVRRLARADFSELSRAIDEAEKLGNGG